MDKKVRGVFLDTEVFYQDQEINKPAFAMLRAYIQDATDCAMLVSEITFLETVNHYRKRVQKIYDGFNSGLTESRDLFPDLKNITHLKDDSVNELVAEYRRKLRATLKAGFAAQFLPFPRVSHAKILERHIARKKPFDENGRGYGDTLIWLSLIDFLKKQNMQSVAFISNNHKDFALKKDSSAIAETLQQDLDFCGVKTKVLYFSNIYDAVRGFFGNKLETDQKLETQSEWHISLVAKYKTEILEEANSDLDCRADTDRITIENLGAQFTILVAEHQTLSEDEATIRLGVRFWKSNILLWNWNKHWDIFTNYNADVDCWLVVVIEPKTRIVKSLEASLSDVFTVGSPLSQRRERLT